MKTTLLVTTFNSISQLLYTYLKDKNHKVDVVFATSLTRDEEIENFKPDLILCPFLKHYIPASIYEKYPTFVFHPGIKGDRGAYSLEYALTQKKWGGVILKVDENYDGGDIYASFEFDVRDTYKASLYRNEVKKGYFSIFDEFFKNYKEGKKTSQILNPLNKKPSIKIDWQKDSTKTIIKKINTLDSFPGVEDELLSLRCTLFGAWEEERLKGDKPKEILAKRDGAICLSTIDGALWITHLKTPNGFKLPSTYVLKDKLKGIKEQRLPLLFDMSYKTFYEISSTKDGDVAYLCFNFHNGAMNSEQCIRLKYAFEHLSQSAKVIVLVGGRDFFSNGIHLNILEDSKKNGEDGWSNINAMNDLVKSVIFAEDVITVASLHQNSGAGGVFLALACDYVIASKSAVLNPHYKTLGLSGSEYHTYTLPKKVGKEMAKKLLDECLPISSKQAKDMGMLDAVLDDEDYFKNLRIFCDKLLVDEDEFDDFIYDKQDYLEENKDMIEQAKEDEIKIMYDEFWGEKSSFHKLRYDFVYKICPTKTPKRLKYNA
ncbi:MAG: hydrogenase [Epsilonproteobacteria bacterium]|nr:hydrogenase [Campylobacterota bacterium]